MRHKGTLCELNLRSHSANGMKEKWRPCLLFAFNLAALYESHLHDIYSRPSLPTSSHIYSNTQRMLVSIATQPPTPVPESKKGKTYN
jgi:hypothetical protein